MSKKRLFIVGLDGATFDLIRPWVKEGKLKTLGKLMSHGTWGELKSTLPPITGPAWSSFMTGKNPGQSGIHDFLIGDGGDQRVISFMDIAGETFWDTAGRAGKRSTIVNVPVTYPPQIRNGVLLSGMLTPPGRPFGSDDQIIQELKKAIGEYVVDLDILTLSSLNRERSLSKLFTMIEKRQECVAFLKERRPFDLMVVVFKAPDIVCHRLWNKQDVVLQVYDKLDQYLESFMNDQDNLFVMSDHGFAAFRKGVRVNQYLHDKGLLARKKADFEDGVTHGSTSMEKVRFGSKGDWVHRLARVPWEVFLKLGITRNRLGGVLDSVGLYDLVREHFPRVLKRALPVSPFIVDRENSKAYLDSRRTRGIVINKALRGNKSYAMLRDDIREKLLDITDPATGKKVLRGVYKKEEVYWGAHMDGLPDLYLEPEDDYLLRDDFGDKVVFEFPAPRSNHHPNGIFIAYGPDISKGKFLEGLEITDVAPTALHLLGVPIPDDMDGKVIREVFKERSEPFTRTIQYAAPVQPTKSGEVLMSEEDESAIKDGLRALGYMD
jgi:predicted AlkP superfamily phosphohydrolase/phosphomutase